MTNIYPLRVSQQSQILPPPTTRTTATSDVPNILLNRDPFPLLCTLYDSLDPEHPHNTDPLIIQICTWDSVLLIPNGVFILLFAIQINLKGKTFKVNTEVIPASQFVKQDLEIFHIFVQELLVSLCVGYCFVFFLKPV